MSAAATRPSGTRGRWLKRLGYFGFAFFLIKGLMWLAGGLVFYWLL